jgi:hypothetical protein
MDEERRLGRHGFGHGIDEIAVIPLHDISARIVCFLEPTGGRQSRATGGA